MQFIDTPVTRLLARSVVDMTSAWCSQPFIYMRWGRKRGGELQPWHESTCLPLPRKRTSFVWSGHAGPDRRIQHTRTHLPDTSIERTWAPPGGPTHIWCRIACCMMLPGFLFDCLPVGVLAREWQWMECRKHCIMWKWKYCSVATEASALSDQDLAVQRGLIVFHYT